MTHLLPPNLLKAFAPRQPLPYLKPVQADAPRKKPIKLSGMAEYVLMMRADPRVRRSDSSIVPGQPIPVVVVPRSAGSKRQPAVKKVTEKGEVGKEEKKENAEEGQEVEKKEKEEEEEEEEEADVQQMTADERFLEQERKAGTLADMFAIPVKRQQKKLAKEQALAKAIEKYNPKDDPEVQGDPLRTLFVGRLSYETAEQDLRQAFASFGEIERVRVVRDSNGKSRGYAFVLFARERDMEHAYKRANRMLIARRPILTDVERGRTVRAWKPRRLGGGLGGRPKQLKRSQLPPPHSGRPHSSYQSNSSFHSSAPPFRGPPPRSGYRSGPPMSGPPSSQGYRDRTDAGGPRGPGGPAHYDGATPPTSYDSRPLSSYGDRDRDRYRERERERDRGRDGDRPPSRSYNGYNPPSHSQSDSGYGSYGSSAGPPPGGSYRGAPDSGGSAPNGSRSAGPPGAGPPPPSSYKRDHEGSFGGRSSESSYRRDSGYDDKRRRY